MSYHICKYLLQTLGDNNLNINFTESKFRSICEALVQNNDISMSFDDFKEIVKNCKGLQEILEYFEVTCVISGCKCKQSEVIENILNIIHLEYELL